MKPKFRLHVHGSNEYNCHWTCSVRFETPSTEVLLNSGPCTQPRTAIAEATMLMRFETGHKYR